MDCGEGTGKADEAKGLIFIIGMSQIDITAQFQAIEEPVCLGEDTPE